MNTIKLAIVKNRKEIVKSEQITHDFIETINHELRTPLTVSKAGLDIILDKLTGELNEEQEKMLTMAKNSLDRLAKVVENLPGFISGDRASLL